MRFIYRCLCFASVLKVVVLVPFVFPDETRSPRQEKKLEPVITPPVLPVLEHLERDPSTLLPSERRPNLVKPKFGFGGSFNVAPLSTGGISGSISSSANGGGSSHSASQAFSFGFNEGFSASHSASQASSFNGFGSGFSGSQASSQAASFAGSGQSFTGAASSASTLGNNFGGNFGSQSASSAFGFNSLNSFQQPDFFGDGLLDNRNRGAFSNYPSFPSFNGRGKGIGAAAFRSARIGPSSTRTGDDILAVLVSD